jgi:hypothetical protein
VSSCSDSRSCSPVDVMDDDDNSQIVSSIRDHISTTKILPHSHPTFNGKFCFSCIWVSEDSDFCFYRSIKAHVCMAFIGSLYSYG